MEVKWTKDGKVEVKTEEKRELGALLDMWKLRNWGRVLLPLASGVVGMLGLVSRSG
jgi:hypothetical protein